MFLAAAEDVQGAQRASGFYLPGEFGLFNGEILRKPAYGCVVSLYPHISTPWTVRLLLELSEEMNIDESFRCYNISISLLCVGRLHLQVPIQAESRNSTSTVLKHSLSGTISTTQAIIIAVGKPLMAKLADVCV